MGIKGFGTWVSTHMPHVKRPMRLEELRGKRAALDSGTLLQRLLRSPLGVPYDKFIAEEQYLRRVQRRFLGRWAENLAALRGAGLDIMCVFDGPLRPDAKYLEAQRRSQLKERNRLQLQLQKERLARVHTLRRLVSELDSPARGVLMESLRPFLTDLGLMTVVWEARDDKGLFLPDAGDLISKLLGSEISGYSLQQVLEHTDKMKDVVAQTPIAYEILKSWASVVQERQLLESEMNLNIAAPGIFLTEHAKEMYLYGLIAQAGSDTHETLAGFIDGLAHTSLALAITNFVRNTSIGNSMMGAIKRIARDLGCSIYQIDDDSTLEAEAVCSSMAASGHASIVLSEDSDNFIYGSNYVSQLGGIAADTPLVYNDVHELYRALGVDRRQFVDAAILIGTDYSYVRIKGIGPRKAFSLVKEYGSIEGIMANAGYSPAHPELFANMVKDSRDLFVLCDVDALLSSGELRYTPAKRARRVKYRYD